MAEIVALPPRPNEIIIPSIRGNLPASYWRYWHAAREVSSFWRDHRETYQSALRSSGGTTVLCQTFDKVFPLATFFDTVVVADHSTMLSDGVDDAEAQIQSVISNFYTWNKLIPVLRAETESPILAVAPDPPPPAGNFEELRRQALENDFDNPATERAFIDWKELIQRLGHIPSSDDWSPAELFSANLSERLLLSDLDVDWEQLSRILSPAFASLLSARIPGIRDEYIRVCSGSTSSISRVTYHWILSALFGMFYHFVTDETICFSIDAYPQIHAPNAYGAYLEIEGKQTSELIGCSAEYAAAQTFSLQEMPWLADLDLIGLERFREVGGLDFIRSTLISSLQNVKRASRIDFEDVCQRLGSEISRIAARHQIDFREENESFRSQLISSGLGLSGGIAATFVTSLLPTPFNIAASLGVAALGPSPTILEIREIIAEHRVNLDSLTSRPIGVLIEYRSSRRG